MAKGNKRKFGSLRYPNAQLTDDSDFLEIKVVEYKPPGFNRSQDQALKMRTSSEVLKKNIGKPLTEIPDPFKKFNSFGEHNNAMLIEFLKKFNFKFNFKSSTENYK